MRIEPKHIRSTEFPDLSELGLYHFQSEYLFTNPDNTTRLVSGFGTSDSKTIAAQKSVFELFERISFRHVSQTLGVNSSNGFAAHMDYTQAARNACLESIERDVFFNFWLLKKSPSWISESDQLSNNHLFLRLRESCKSMDWELHIGVGLESKGIYVIFGVITDLRDRFGGFINTAGSLDLDAGINSVVFTLSRYITVVKNRMHNNLSLFKNEGIPKLPVDHFEYYLDPQNFKKINWLFETGTVLPWNKKYDAIEVKKIDIDLDFPITCVVAYAHSDHLQTYFSGPTLLNKLNFSYRQIFSTLNLEIHPLP